MALRLIFDGVQLPSSDYSLENADITIRRNDETGLLATSYGGGVTFRGETYNRIYTDILSNPNGRNVTIPVAIFDDCCNETLFYGRITGDSLDWCYDKCEVTADIKEGSADADLITCAQSTYIFDNHNGFQQKNHLFFRHCTEMRPSILQDGFLAIGLCLHIFFYVMFPLIAVISAIIVLINAIASIVGEKPIPDEGNNGIVDWFNEVINTVDGYISGCTKGHPAPYVRDYIQNACQKCGLQFQSTILNQDHIQGNESWNPINVRYDSSGNALNPYWTLAHFSAPVHRGEEDYVTWIDDDKPLMTLDKYLQFLGKVFNAEYRIQNGILTFERKDFFKNSTVWIDLSGALPDNFESLCFNYSPNAIPAYGRYEYLKDGVDWVGNEANYLYNDIIPFNLPLGSYPQFRGERMVQLEASMSRFRNDGLDRDVLTDWQQFFDFVGATDLLVKADYDNALLLPVDLSFYPKLLVYDNVSPPTNAKVIYENISGQRRFNRDMWFGTENQDPNVGYQSKVYIAGNLYDRFHYIDDPRLNLREGKQYTLRLRRTCTDILNLDFNSSVLLPGGFYGSIREVSIGKDVMEVRGDF